MPKRPKYLNLIAIRLPLPGIVSFMHRVSGAVLFFALPVFLWWLQQSLNSGSTYTALQGVFSNGLVKVVATGLVWGYMHHLCAGIRYLFLDMDMGTDLALARLSGKVVLAVSITLTVFAGGLIW